ncbi:hypothetical protein [Burkholderia pseudomultivorans]|uniref:hypothetical protein n=1 Tax=Burkholderia pseudomultivorans TaxID=1207504 RepID=UPI0012D8CD70|nr:hypothetical protein [Burkholderia pseudomultivorans]
MSKQACRPVYSRFRGNGRLNFGPVGSARIIVNRPVMADGGPSLRIVLPDRPRSAVEAIGPGEIAKFKFHRNEMTMTAFPVGGGPGFVFNVGIRIYRGWETSR